VSIPISSVNCNFARVLREKNEKKGGKSRRKGVDATSNDEKGEES